MPYEDVAAFIAELRQAGSHRGAGAGILHSDRRPLRRNPGDAVVGNRPRQENLDGARGPDEGGPGAPRSVVARAPSQSCASLQKRQDRRFVFAGQARNKPLSNMAMEMVLRRMKIEDATVHGFRSSFRDWAGNVSSFPREVDETALAHVIGDKAEQAYRRSDALEKRRKLMDAWAAYCGPKGATNVVAIRRK